MISNNEFKAIAELDLDPIKVKLMHKESGEGWSLEYANTMEFEYRRFLYLMKTLPDEHMAPQFDVDIFWHYHILDTMKYAVDCDSVFGYFLHHFPYVGLRGEEDEAVHHQIGLRMKEVYEETFGEPYMQSLEKYEQGLSAASPQGDVEGAGTKTAWSTRGQAAGGTVAWSTRGQASAGTTAWSTRGQATAGTTAWSTRGQATAGTTAWSTRGQATAGTTAWSTRGQANAGTTAWSTRGQATAGTTAWSTRGQATAGTTAWSTRGQATAGTTAWSTRGASELPSNRSGAGHENLAEDVQAAAQAKALERFYSVRPVLVAA